MTAAAAIVVLIIAVVLVGEEEAKVATLKNYGALKYFT